MKEPNGHLGHNSSGGGLLNMEVTLNSDSIVCRSEDVSDVNHIYQLVTSDPPKPFVFECESTPVHNVKVSTPATMLAVREVELYECCKDDLKTHCNDNSNSENFGCYQGYCWSYCTTAIAGSSWCYTTTSSKPLLSHFFQGGEKQTCSSDSDCGCSWFCSDECRTGMV